MKNPGPACPICSTPYPDGDIEPPIVTRPTGELGDQRIAMNNLSMSSIGHAVIRVTDFFMCVALVLGIALALAVVFIALRTDGPFWASVADGMYLVLAVIGSCSIWAALSGIYRNGQTNTAILEQIARIDNVRRDSTGGPPQLPKRKITTQQSLILGSVFLVAAGLVGLVGIYGYDALKARQAHARQVELSDVRSEKAERDLEQAVEKFRRAQPEADAQRAESRGWVEP